ncbi:MAG: N-acetyltransferase family protein [Kofleriaceae bacterium]
MQAVFSSLWTARFAVRPATLDDAIEIARVQTQSWQSSYRGILPDSILDTMDPTRRIGSRREIIADSGALNLVAYDTTHGDIVGFANAGPSRRQGQLVGELYEIYILNRAKRYGLGRELFDVVADWCRSRHMATMIVWVLEGNTHARRFYEAMGGQVAGQTHSTLRGFGVVEVSYLYRL